MVTVSSNLRLGIVAWCVFGVCSLLGFAWICPDLFVFSIVVVFLAELGVCGGRWAGA